MPVPGTGFALLLLLEGEQLEPGEQRNESGGIAIEMRVPAVLGPVDDKGTGSNGAASSVIDVASRQHRALVQRAGLQHAPDLGETAPDIPHSAVMDHVP